MLDRKYIVLLMLQCAVSAAVDCCRCSPACAASVGVRCYCTVQYLPPTLIVLSTYFNLYLMLCMIDTAY